MKMNFVDVAILYLNLKYKNSNLICIKSREQM